MKVELQTNLANPSLVFSDFRGVGVQVHAAMLSVVSGSYQAHLRFLFDDEVFIAFIEDLQRMDRDLRGKTRLREFHTQEPFVAFEVTQAGSVEVSGVLVDWEHGAQRMEFHFEADQSVLKTFADELANARAMQIAAQTDE